MFLIDKLEKVGFTKAEALIYMELLRNPGLNGTQLSKNLGIPRTTTYQALDNLLFSEKIYLIPTDSDKKNYTPLEPRLMVERIVGEYTEILNDMGLDLEKIYSPTKFNEVYNISGVDNVYYKINDMIKYANTKVVIQGKIDLEKIFLTNDNVEFKDEDDTTELVVIADESEILITSYMVSYTTALYTKNELILNKYLKGNK